MNKDEILQKSREENKNEDMVEKEILLKGGNIGAISATFLATLFFVIQIFLGGGLNYGIYAIVFSIQAGNFIYKALKLKRKHETLVAVCYCILVLIFSAAYIYTLACPNGNLV